MISHSHGSQSDGCPIPEYGFRNRIEKRSLQNSGGVWSGCSCSSSRRNQRLSTCVFFNRWRQLGRGCDDRVLLHACRVFSKRRPRDLGRVLLTDLRHRLRKWYITTKLPVRNSGCNNSTGRQNRGERSSNDLSRDGGISLGKRDSLRTAEQIV